MSKTANSDAILKVLKRGPKKGLTAAQIAERAGLNLNSTRTALWGLKADGSVTAAGKTETGTVGRPSYLYVIA